MSSIVMVVQTISHFSCTTPPHGGAPSVREQIVNNRLTALVLAVAHRGWLRMDRMLDVEEDVVVQEALLRPLILRLRSHDRLRRRNGDEHLRCN